MSTLTLVILSVIVTPRKGEGGGEKRFKSGEKRKDLNLRGRKDTINFDSNVGRKDLNNGRNDSNV